MIVDRRGMRDKLANLCTLRIAGSYRLTSHVLIQPCVDRVPMVEASPSIDDSREATVMKERALS